MAVNAAGAKPRHGQLLAVGGVPFGVAVTVGSAVGVGILRSPSRIAAEMPGVWPYLAVWLAAGAYALLVANAYGELATRTQATGGQYVWIRAAFGDAPAFVAGCLDWLATCGVLAVAASVLGEYAVGLFPALRAPEVIALVAIIIVLLVQGCGTRVSFWFQNVSSLLKVGALLIFVAFCVYFGTRSVTSAAAVITDREGSLAFAVFIALEAAVFTYHGTAAATYFAGEYRDGKREIPRALFIGVGAVLSLYLAVNLGILRVVPLATIAGRGAATDVVADRLFGADGSVPARALVTIALLSAISSAALIAPRILYAMSRDGLFWRGAGDVNRRGTPEMGVMLSCGLAAVLAITRTFDAIVVAVAIIFVANAAASFAALFRLRQRPGSGFAAIGHPATTVIGLACSIAFLAAAVVVDHQAAINAAGLAAVSLLLFALARIHRPVLT